MTLNPDRYGEALVTAYLRSGRFQSPEEVVTRALETLRDKEQPAIRAARTPAEAIAHIRESRKGVRLGGLKIKNLIHEGHRY